MFSTEPNNIPFFVSFSRKRLNFGDDCSLKKSIQWYIRVYFFIYNTFRKDIFMKKMIFQKAGNAAEERIVLKASLHTHTTNSDGKFTPAQIIDMYKDAGYDVINFSDHSTVNKVSEYDGKGMTLISARNSTSR